MDMAALLPHARGREGSQNTGMDPTMYRTSPYPRTPDVFGRNYAEVLTDMLPLLHATQNPPPDLGIRSLLYDMGPWKGENLLTGIESFFQKNAYHPFATCGNPRCGKTGPIPLSTSTPSTNPEIGRAHV